MLEVETILTKKITPEKYKKISDWLKVSSEDNKHHENYIDVMNDKDHIAISFAKSDGEYEAFSTIYHREFYPKNCYRVMTRFFVDPKHRTSYYRTQRPFFQQRTIDMFHKQFEYCEMLNADVIFTTLHCWKPLWSKHLTEAFSDISGLEWKCEEIVQVAPGKGKKCYQHVIYLELNESQEFKKFLSNKITHTEWLLLNN